MKIALFIMISIVAAGSGQLLLRAGAMESNSLIADNIFSLQEWTILIMNYKLVSGLIMWTISSLAYIIVLTKVEISFVYCLGSLNYLIIPFLSHLLLRESIGCLRMVGMILIFIGVALTLYGKYIEYTNVKL